MAATSCAGASHSARSVAPRHPTPAPAVSGSSAPVTGSPTPTSTGLGTGPITAQAFGMHYLGYGSHPYPALPFGTSRIWDMGVTWKDVAPSPDSAFTGTGSTGLQRLDDIIATFARHHVEPVVTLGMTPAWAARSCHHVVRGMDWGSQTCAPRDTSASGPWGRYVRGLAKRYRHQVRYFELWNEPSLRNGWNDSMARLVQLQVTAHHILQSLGYGQELLAPSIAFTDGAPTHGLKFLDRFLSQPGGTEFDIVSLHLYPADAPAKAGTGPEWAMQVALPAARSVLATHGVGNREIWNTESNVGRVPAGVTFSGVIAAGMVARTFVLAAENGIPQTIWYAADDRSWGGVWLEDSDFRSVTPAGLAERTIERLLVGARPTGCQAQPGGHHACTFSLNGGRQLLALWTTGRSYAARAPVGAKRAYSVTGEGRRLGKATIPITSAPTYFVIRRG